jgi:predicted hydrocarbon binding protein
VAFLANFEFDEDKGIIRDKLTGERCLIVYKKGVENIFKRLSQIFDSGTEPLLLESSRAAAKNIVDSIGKEAKTDVKRSLNAYTERFAQVGFGRVEVCELELEKARIRLRVRNNIFAEIRDEESTYCSYIAGLVSGIYEGLLHKVPRVKEVRCIGKGDPYCEFLLARKA